MDARSIWGRFGIDSGPIRGRFGGGAPEHFWYLRRCFSVSPGVPEALFLCFAGAGGVAHHAGAEQELEH